MPNCRYLPQAVRAHNDAPNVQRITVTASAERHFGAPPRLFNLLTRQSA